MSRRLQRWEVLVHPRRREILRFIEAEPGLCIQDLARKLGNSSKTTLHHVDVLRDFGHVRALTIQRKVCLFRAGDDVRRGRVRLLLRDPTRRAVLETILQSPGCSASHVRCRLTMSKSTANYHLRFLVHEGVLREADSATPGRRGQVGYFVNGHAVELLEPAAAGQPPEVEVAV